MDPAVRAVRLPARRAAGAGRGRRRRLHGRAPAAADRCRVRPRWGRRCLRPEDRGRGRGAAERRRPAGDGDGGQGHRGGAAGAAGGRRCRVRAGEPGVDRGAPADPQAGRVLGRPGRRAVVGRADRRCRCGADRPRRPGHRRRGRRHRRRVPERHRGGQGTAGIHAGPGAGTFDRRRPRTDRPASSRPDARRGRVGGEPEPRADVAGARGRLARTGRPGSPEGALAPIAPPPSSVRRRCSPRP